MHLCNFGQYFDTCPGKIDCTGPGGTTYTKDGLYGNYDQWNNRVWIRDTLQWLLPGQSTEIRQKVVPGEYGMESALCRALCTFLFVMWLVDDFTETLNMLLLIRHVPTRAESWLTRRLPDPDVWDGKNKHEVKRILGKSEIDFVRFRIQGMPLIWKILNLVFVITPKLVIWLVLLTAGTQFLMETAAIQDLIINSLAMCFILQIDELIAGRLCTEATKAMMSRLEAYDLFSISDDEKLDDQAIMNHYMDHEVKYSMSDTETLVLLFPKRLTLILLITAICYNGYFFRFCVGVADGSYISEDIYPPRQIQKIGTWLVEWLFAPGTIERTDSPSWSMPTGPIR